MALAVNDDQAGRVFFESTQALGTPIDALHPLLLCKIILDVALRPYV
jgi:hypothetical protein